MRDSTGMFELALFLAILGVSLTIAFTAFYYTERDVMQMPYKTDVRQIQQVSSGGLSFNYMNRPGAYLDAMRLSFSIGTASADSRARINVFGEVLDIYDMYVMNASEMNSVAPFIYSKLEEWWEGFRASPQYQCVYGNACPGPIACGGDKEHGTAIENTYNFGDSSHLVRTFAPKHIDPVLSGFELDNPTELDKAKFKMRLVENGVDADGEVLLEYRVFIFLGSLTRHQAMSTPMVEYRWYECVMGTATQPWVILQ